jgi:hypothetical protein
VIKEHIPSVLAADSAAAVAWMETADAVTRGLTHSLGNRMFSVWSIGTALRERPAEPRWGEAFDAEMARLEALLNLFRSLALDGEGELEPIALPDVLAVAVALLGQHADVRAIPVELPVQPPAMRPVADAVGTDDGAGARQPVPPVLAHRSSLIQALLLLLSDAARESADEGTSVVVRFHETASDDLVSLEVMRRAPGSRSGLVRAAELLLAHAGGTVAVGGDVAGRRLTLPALGAARRALEARAVSPSSAP